MPRHTRRNQQSQRETSPMDVDEEPEFASQSSEWDQPSQRVSQTASQVNDPELINKCVRFILYKTGDHLPIKKSDLQKALGSGRSTDALVKSASSILREIYGYTIYSQNTPSNKLYFVRNNLPPMGHSPELSIEEKLEDVHIILTMLVLTHVFMSEEKVKEASLLQFLQSLRINPDVEHPLFGNVLEHINDRMIKEKYLEKEVDQYTKAVSYVWGVKAQNEVSKEALLNFVCKVYQNRTPSAWTKQFLIANEQKRLHLLEE